MIVDAAPRLTTVIREVWRPLAALFVWDVAVTVFYVVSPFHAPELPLTIFGTALGLFLGFRSNSAYQRWWEGRVLWGALINASRSLARGALAFLAGDDAVRIDLRRTIVLRQIAYAHALRCQLRRQRCDEDVRRFLSGDEARAPLERQNPANALLDGTALRIAQARREGLIDTIQQVHLEDMLVDLANAQGGMERLKNTPLPNQFRFLPSFFTRLFCVLLPIGLVETLGLATPAGSTIAGLMFLGILQIADDLVDPFANTVHDLPLTAMSRTVEINLLEAIGDAAPGMLQPDRGVLW